MQGRAVRAARPADRCAAQPSTTRPAASDSQTCGSGTATICGVMAIEPRNNSVITKCVVGRGESKQSAAVLQNSVRPWAVSLEDGVELVAGDFMDQQKGFGLRALEQGGRAGCRVEARRRHPRIAGLQPSEVLGIRLFARDEVGAATEPQVVGHREAGDPVAGRRRPREAGSGPPSTTVPRPTS